MKTKTTKNTQHESYPALIWTLARTDFTLRYHGSVLGYVWALLKPLLIFAILYTVFSSIFNPRSTGNEFYALELLVSLLLFNFFAEGTSAGMSSLLNKSQLITKIYVPRWALIIASTLNSAMVFCTNVLVIVVFFFYKQFIPSFSGVLLFLLFVICTYALIVAFSLVASPLFVRFRDLSMIWEVILTGLLYATPIIYPLSMMPQSLQQVILANPLGFIVHFVKQGLIQGHFPDLWQMLIFLSGVIVFFVLSIFGYRRFSQRLAEYI
jgi:ABC-2 type transport system permease protein